jgi:hypothetical protein
VRAPRPSLVLCAPICAVALSACASTVSTSSFTGAKHNVAQTISNLQADATASEKKKICTTDLAATVVARLGGAKGCEAAIKSQLAEIDSFEVSVQSIDVAAGEASATAHVKSIEKGKSTPATVALVKEAGKWKISAFGQPTS